MCVYIYISKVDPCIVVYIESLFAVTIYRAIYMLTRYAVRACLAICSPINLREGGGGGVQQINLGGFVEMGEWEGFAGGGVGALAEHLNTHPFGSIFLLLNFIFFNVFNYFSGNLAICNNFSFYNSNSQLCQLLPLPLVSATVSASQVFSVGDQSDL